MDSPRRALLNRRLLIAAALAGVAAAACSPEDGRRIGERGADPGNRPDDPRDVELHGTSNPSYKVPDKAPAAGRTQDGK